MTDYLRAKEIYFAYSSSKFQMMRDGFSIEYCSYEVPENIEDEWLIELISRELKKLDINSVDSLFPLWYILETNCNIVYLKDIVVFIENNIYNVDSALNLLLFTQKVLKTMDEIDLCCSQISRLELDRYRKQIKMIRKEKI